MGGGGLGGGGLVKVSSKKYVHFTGEDGHSGLIPKESKDNHSNVEFSPRSHVL